MKNYKRIMATILMSTVFTSSILLVAPNNTVANAAENSTPTANSDTLYNPIDTDVYEQKLYKNGELFTGFYKKKNYKDGVLFSGFYKDKLYKKGKLYTGFYKDKNYKDGKLFTGIYKKKYYYKNGKLFSGIHKEKYYKKGLLSTGTFKGNKYVVGSLFSGQTGGFFLDNGHINPLAKNGKCVIMGAKILEMKNGVAYRYNPYTRKKKLMTGLNYINVTYAKGTRAYTDDAYVAFDKKGKLATGYYKIGKVTTQKNYTLIPSNPTEAGALVFKDGYPTSATEFAALISAKTNDSSVQYWNPYFNK